MEMFAHMMAAMKNVLSPNSDTMMTERAAKNPCRNRSSDIEEPEHKNYLHYLVWKNAMFYFLCEAKKSGSYYTVRVHIRTY
jgi:hypothetical protein